VESSGVLEVVAMTEFSYQGFVDTLSESDNIKAKDLEGAIIVVSMFFVLWGIGLLCVCELSRLSACAKYNKKSGVIFVTPTPEEAAIVSPHSTGSAAGSQSRLNVGIGRHRNRNLDNPMTPLELEMKNIKRKEFLTAYINQLLPAAFQTATGSAWSCLWIEIKKHHRYALVFTLGGTLTRQTEELRIRTGIHMLTVQTMLMFLLAVFYGKNKIIFNIFIPL
jgi:hypothetical protein